jgi:hypothetical protein
MDVVVSESVDDYYKVKTIIDKMNRKKDSRITQILDYGMQ